MPLSDYAIFGGFGGSITPCAMGLANTTVDRVIMYSDYTAILGILHASRLNTNNYFDQYGTLAMFGTGAIFANDFINIHGVWS